MRWLTLFVTGLVLQAAPAAAQHSQKLALIIGNSRYAEAPLKNPVNDSRAMAQALRARGFEVITREDASKQQMEKAIADFGEKLNEGATGLFFYAGHGVQVQGRNYLVPIDAHITSEQRVRLEAVDVEAVLDQMQAARSRVSMVILDACRNNPFERRFRSTGGGLAQINAPEGTLIAYATAPGKVAADGTGANGLYTQEILKALGTPGLKVEDVFKQVRINVSRASDGNQVPWEASSLTGDFYFVAPAPVAAAPVGPDPADLALWETVKSSASPGEIQAYLDRFPSGLFAGVARTRMASLNRPVSPPRAPAPQQQASLPSPADPDIYGRYYAYIDAPGRKLNAVLELQGHLISGFATIADGDSIAGNVGFHRFCRVNGRTDRGGTIEHMELDCGVFSWRFTGRFGLDDDGQRIAKTSAQSVSAGNLASVLWKKVAAPEPK